jgi:hypothetical protein
VSPERLSRLIGGVHNPDRAMGVHGAGGTDRTHQQPRESTKSALAKNQK